MIKIRNCTICGAELEKGHRARIQIYREEPVEIECFDGFQVVKRTKSVSKAVTICNSCADKIAAKVFA